MLCEPAAYAAAGSSALPLFCRFSSKKVLIRPNLQARSNSHILSASPPQGRDFVRFRGLFAKKPSSGCVFAVVFELWGWGLRPCGAKRRNAQKYVRGKLLGPWGALGRLGWLAGLLGEARRNARFGGSGGGPPSAPQARKILGFSDGRTQAKHVQNIWKSHIPHSSGAGVGTVGDDVPPPPRQATLAARPGTKQKISKTYVKPYALRARSLRRSRLVGVASILQIFFQKSLDSAQSTCARQFSYTKRKPPAGAQNCPFSRTLDRKSVV